MKKFSLLGILLSLLLVTVDELSADSTPQLCLLAFHDKNANGEREQREPLAANVKIAVLDSADNAYFRYWTNGRSEPHCLTDIPNGTYQVLFEENGTSHLSTPLAQEIVVVPNSGVTTVAFGGEFHPTETGATTQTEAQDGWGRGGAITFLMAFLLWLIVMMLSNPALMLGIRKKIYVDSGRWE